MRCEGVGIGLSRTRNWESRISLWAHDISFSLSVPPTSDYLSFFFISTFSFFFFFFCFWHKSGNKLSDTKSSPSRSQNKGINTRRTTEMAARHALDQLTTQKSKTKTSIGIRIAYGFGIECGCGGGIEHSNRIRIRSKTKQIERLPRMQNAEWTEWTEECPKSMDINTDNMLRHGMAERSPTSIGMWSAVRENLTHFYENTRNCWKNALKHLNVRFFPCYFLGYLLSLNIF